MNHSTLLTAASQPQKFDRLLSTLWRQINRRPEPLPEEFQERFLATLDEDADFRDALRSYLLPEPRE